jgi:hypothetical protein
VGSCFEGFIAKNTMCNRNLIWILGLRAMTFFVSKDVWRHFIQIKRGRKKITCMQILMSKKVWRRFMRSWSMRRKLVFNGNGPQKKSRSNQELARCCRREFCPGRETGAGNGMWVRDQVYGPNNRTVAFPRFSPKQ